MVVVVVVVVVDDNDDHDDDDDESCYNFGLRALLGHEGAARTADATRTAGPAAAAPAAGPCARCGGGCSA